MLDYLLFYNVNDYTLINFISWSNLGQNFLDILDDKKLLTFEGLKLLDKNIH